MWRSSKQMVSSRKMYADERVEGQGKGKVRTESPWDSA